MNTTKQFDTVWNYNLFLENACGLLTLMLRGKSKPSANMQLSDILKKGGLVVNQTVVLLMKCVQAKKNATEESG